MRKYDVTFYTKRGGVKYHNMTIEARNVTDAKVKAKEAWNETSTDPIHRISVKWLRENKTE